MVDDPSDARGCASVDQAATQQIRKEIFHFSFAGMRDSQQLFQGGWWDDVPHLLPQAGTDLMGPGVEPHAC